MTGHTHGEHMLRARRLTPERYDLVLRALHRLIEECIVDDEFGTRCVYCTFETTAILDKVIVHDEDCLAIQVDQLLQELEQEEAEAQQRREQLKEISRIGQEMELEDEGVQILPQDATS